MGQPRRGRERVRTRGAATHGPRLHRRAASCSWSSCGARTSWRGTARSCAELPRGSDLAPRRPRLRGRVVAVGDGEAKPNLGPGRAAAQRRARARPSRHADPRSWAAAAGGRAQLPPGRGQLLQSASDDVQPLHSWNSCHS